LINLDYKSAGAAALHVHQPELAARAFDTICAMNRAQDLEALSASAGSMFEQLGLPSFALARFFRRGGAPDVTVLDGAFHQQWSQRYLANRYVDVSQIAREMTVCQTPYSWDEVMERRPVTRIQKQIRGEAAMMGLTEGLFTPVAWPDGSYVAVALGGPGRALGDRMLRTYAEIVSSYYACESRRFLAPPPRPGQPLSPRQRECLSWVRHGKSSSVIADLLGLSVQTVDEHVAQACRKMGVRTRIQAAVEASLQGVID
jgi:DNA-binding CsgD family transcriptional regulator